MSITAPKSRNDIVTIPNIITLFGIIFVFCYLIAFLLSWNRWAIFSFIFAAGFSDLLDGFFARRLDQKTHLGEVLDPFRDRLLLLAILLHIMLIYGFSMLIIGIVIFEVFVVLIKLLSLVMRMTIEVHWVGKLRQFIHVACGGIIMLKFYFYDLSARFFPYVNSISIEKILWIMFAASAVSMAAYTLSQINDINDKDMRRKNKFKHPHE